MAVSTRQGLIDYCLRELGEPISEVNVDELQVEDRIDEALEYWTQYHFEGTEKFYLKQQVTASSITLTTEVATSFLMAEIVIGSVSGAKAKVTKEWNRESSGATLLVRNVTGTFVAGETLTGDNSGFTAVLATNPLVLGSYDKKYFDLPDAVYGVSRVIPFNNASSSKNIFDLQYQLRLNDLYDLTSTSIIYYKTVMSHLALLDLELNGKPMFRFNRMQGQLRLDVNWESDIALGDFIVIECYRALDPTTWSRVWNEQWLKHYATALIKRQWGANGKKFQGLVLPGGVSVDWQGIYDEARDEIKELQDDLLNKSAPLEFFMG
jgi:hypothetical protein